MTLLASFLVLLEIWRSKRICKRFMMIIQSSPKMKSYLLKLGQGISWRIAQSSLFTYHVSFPKWIGNSSKMRTSDKLSFRIMSSPKNSLRKWNLLGEKIKYFCNWSNLIWILTPLLNKCIISATVHGQGRKKKEDLWLVTMINGLEYKRNCWPIIATMARIHSQART